MIDIIYHDGASAAPDQAGQSGGFAQADGNGEIHCYSWLDGVSAMLMRLEMESYTYGASHAEGPAGAQFLRQRPL